MCVGLDIVPVPARTRGCRRQASEGWHRGPAIRQRTSDRTLALQTRIPVSFLTHLPGSAMLSSVVHSSPLRHSAVCPMGRPNASRRRHEQRCNTAPRSIYELPASGGKPSTPEADAKEGADDLQDVLLVDHVLWFVRLRWLAIAACSFLAGWALAVTSCSQASISARPTGWPFLAATLLLVGNVGFLVHARRMARRPAATGCDA